MAHSPSMKELEERRKALVAENNRLREAFAERCEELGASSFWISQGFELAQRLLAHRAILSTALNLFRSSRD